MGVVFKKVTAVLGVFAERTKTCHRRRLTGRAAAQRRARRRRQLLRRKQISESLPKVERPGGGAEGELELRGILDDLRAQVGHAEWRRVLDAVPPVAEVDHQVLEANKLFAFTDLKMSLMSYQHVYIRCNKTNT